MPALTTDSAAYAASYTAVTPAKSKPVCPTFPLLLQSNGSLTSTCWGSDRWTGREEKIKVSLESRHRCSSIQLLLYYTFTKFCCGSDSYAVISIRGSTWGHHSYKLSMQAAWKTHHSADSSLSERNLWSHPPGSGIRTGAEKTHNYKQDPAFSSVYVSAVGWRHLQVEPRGRDQALTVMPGSPLSPLAPSMPISPCNMDNRY